MALSEPVRRHAAPALGIATGFGALVVLQTGSETLLAVDAVLAMATAVASRLPTPTSATAAAAAAAAEPATSFEPVDAADSPPSRAPRAEPPNAEQLRDPETGLLNEHYFQATLRERLASARRSLRPISVALLQPSVIDGGRRPTSAEVTTVGRVLRETLREADTVCRLDRDRFALLLDDTSQEAATAAIERAANTIRLQEPLLLRTGIATYPTHGLAVSEVLEHAEEELRAAKVRRPTSSAAPEPSPQPD